MKRMLIISSSVLLFMLAGCNGQGSNSKQDSLVNGGPDSMPVVQPPITDSGSTIITPPVNDNNVVVPDTTIKK